MNHLSHSELVKRTEFLPRFRYLVLGGELGAATFGFDRPLNQSFYASREWKQIRDQVIVRDNGCDLGIPGYEIHGRILVHHINPIKVQDLIDFNDAILDPEYLICVTTRTHNAIHFGDERQLPREFAPREPGDTKLW